LAARGHHALRAVGEYVELELVARVGRQHHLRVRRLRGAGEADAEPVLDRRAGQISRRGQRRALRQRADRGGAPARLALVLIGALAAVLERAVEIVVAVQAAADVALPRPDVAGGRGDVRPGVAVGVGAARGVGDAVGHARAVTGVAA